MFKINIIKYLIDNKRAKSKPNSSLINYYKKMRQKLGSTPLHPQYLVSS